MNLAEKLARGVSALGLDIAAETQQRLLAYLTLIAKWNRVYNLTAVRETEKMLTHHLLDCLAVIPHLVPARSILDVGSGAGLPGIPLALVWQQSRVTLLEANHKKAAFLRQTAIELRLPNVEVACERAESWQPGRKFDIVISRAFSGLPELLRAAGRFCAEDGVIAAMKGVHPHEELAQLPEGFGVREAIPLTVPGLAAERHLILLQPTQQVVA